MSVKIVGAVSDEGSLEEIESIAKVFAYEQRMKLYALPQQETVLAPKVVQQMTSVHRLIREIPLHHVLVKGLC